MARGGGISGLLPCFAALGQRCDGMIAIYFSSLCLRTVDATLGGRKDSTAVALGVLVVTEKQYYSLLLGHTNSQKS